MSDGQTFGVSIGPPVLSLSLLGQMSVAFAGRQLRIRGHKARAVLAYLALSEARHETRERLVGLLWSESEEEKARASLRQILRELRQTCEEAGYDGLRTERREVELDHDGLSVDVWSVVAEAEKHEAHPALLNGQGLADSLLSGFDDLDPAFRVWLLAKRRTLHDRLLRALEIGLRDASLDSAKRTRLAEAIVNLDPTHEEACQRVMQAKAAAGDTAGALRAYKALWDLLDEDYGMEPSAATQKLVAEIKTGAYEPAEPVQDSVASGSHSAAAGLPERPVPDAVQGPGRGTRLALSVPPAAMHEIDPDRAHLVLGFRQHLISSLVRFREWRVTDAPFTPADVRPAPGAGGRYELQLTAHRGGNAVHLMLMLKEIDTSLYVWTDGFELRLNNWFESQRRVVQRIAMALNVHLSAQRLRRFSGQPDISLGIYDRWLRFQTLVWAFNAEYWERAQRQFTEIVEAAPNFVPACCGLANLESIRHIAYPGVFRTREGERRALEFAQRAVQLDPSDSSAHRCLAWAHAMAKQYALAEMHIETACELNPNDSSTLISAALLLVFCGRPDRGLSLAGPALEIAFAPSRTHWAYNFDIQFLTGRYQAALDAAERAQDVLRGTRDGWRAAALFHLGRVDEAEAAAAQFLAGVREKWRGDEQPSDEAIVHWLLHLYPICRPRDWERLRDGLRGAGLPTGAMRHHDW